MYASDNLCSPCFIYTHSHADLHAKDNDLCTPTHIAAIHKLTVAYHCLMECIPVNLHASVIFTAFDVKCSREVILEVSWCMKSVTNSVSLVLS